MKINNDDFYQEISMNRNFSNNIRRNLSVDISKINNFMEQNKNIMYNNNNFVTNNNYFNTIKENIYEFNNNILKYKIIINNDNLDQNKIVL